MAPIITDIQAILLTGPATYDPYLREGMEHRCAAFIEVRTDAGITGLGETYLGTFWPEVVPLAVEFYRPILIGQSVEDVGELWSRMYACSRFFGRVGMVPAIINGIEAALWDAKGKYMGLPVYELLGGRKHERLLCYATGGHSSHPESRLAAKVRHYLDEGFSAVKLGAGWQSPDYAHYPTQPDEAADLEARKLEFVRREFGEQLLIGLDAHMDFRGPGRTWDLATARAVLRACEPYDLMFFEEPLPYTDPWGYGELRGETRVPVAGGECLTTAYEWRIFTELDAFDVGQPDAAFTGGLAECVKVAAMLEQRGRKIATHCWGAGPALMQNVHVAFACSNTLIVESAASPGPLHTQLMGDSLVMRDGYLLPPEKPGLGVKLSQSTIDRFPFVPGSGQFTSVPGKRFQGSLGIKW